MTTSLAKRLFTLEEYHHLAAVGFFAPGDRVELIRGEIIPMSPKGTKHAVCCRNLLSYLPTVLPTIIRGNVILQCQDPISLPNGSEPEPDFAIAKRREDNYLSGHPTPADLILVIEIADSSLAYDRDIKTKLYAEAGIPHYWLFNLVDDRLETHSEPVRDFYAHSHIYLPEQAIALPDMPESLLELARIFTWRTV